mmetsp:Transcript_36523/g.76010  ORF Transcript_36523/g.76010 Transcript_36523/m.76010 type:complete len:200 (-) Transcript_36523:572-1171(-)
MRLWRQFQVPYWTFPFKGPNALYSILLVEKTWDCKKLMRPAKLFMRMLMTMPTLSLVHWSIQPWERKYQLPSWPVISTTRQFRLICWKNKRGISIWMKLWTRTFTRIGERIRKVRWARMRPWRRLESQSHADSRNRLIQVMGSETEKEKEDDLVASSDELEGAVKVNSFAIATALENLSNYLRAGVLNDGLNIVSLGAN